MANKDIEVLVIGSGAAGAVLTKRLTELGAKVMCLEQGGWIKPSDYPSDRPDWEIQLRRGAEHIGADPAPAEPQRHARARQRLPHAGARHRQRRIPVGRGLPSAAAAADDAGAGEGRSETAERLLSDAPQ